MSYKIVVHSLAKEEYEEAYLWYSEQLPGLGDRFEQAVEQKLIQIADKPKQFPVKRKTYREAKTNTFPYLIVFKIYEREKQVFVSAIYHTSRSPKKKYRRRV